MGIKEYRHLTHTMEEISLLSSKLTKTKKDLSKLKKEIKEVKDEVSETQRKISNSKDKIERSPSQNGDRKIPLSAVNKEIRDLKDEKAELRLDVETSTLHFPLQIRAFNYYTRGPDLDQERGNLLLPFLGAIIVVIGFTEDQRNSQAGPVVLILLLLLYPLLIFRADSQKEKKFGREIELIQFKIEELERVAGLAASVKSCRQSVEEMQEWLRTAEQGVSDSTMQIVRIGEGLALLWSSITHLIPFSTALEKA